MMSKLCWSLPLKLDSIAVSLFSNSRIQITVRRASLSNWNPFPLDSLDLINPAFCPFREDAWAFKPDAFFASNYSSCQYLDFGKSTPYLSRPTQLIFILDFYTHKYKRHNRAICYTYLGIPAHLHIFKCVSSCKDLDSGKSSPYLGLSNNWVTPFLRVPSPSIPNKQCTYFSS